MIIDAHIHCHELGRDELSRYAGRYILVCVSDDPASSRATLELAEEYKGVTPCIGIHPWNVKNHGLSDLRSLLKEAVERGVKCLGEVGLDKRFTPESFSRQLEFFREIAGYAREYGFALNIHAAGAWREVFEEVYGRDLDKVYFHWYTGPLDLLNNIVEAGYYVGLNPAWRLQAKHREVIASVPLRNVLTESDAPYEYRGLKMTPEMITGSLELLASIHGVSVEEVESTIWGNYVKILGA
ncbi:TatD-related deoxyribonuclease [Desulfurococcus mucosus DSM 2162]|uniref:TatD-related deoxyribonuclease n=2 Tax=Desulfurococcus mucosus TaxID=2275 RepID=E8R7T8_DESM0|nr:TatD-related deoxyribonuclease [Desulfurococcus mucosus DSM 2162]